MYDCGKQLPGLKWGAATVYAYAGATSFNGIDCPEKSWLPVMGVEFLKEFLRNQIDDQRVRIPYYTIRRRAQMVEQEHNGSVRSKEDGNGGNVRRKSTGNVNSHRDSYCRSHCVRVYDGRVLGGSAAMSGA